MSIEIVPFCFPIDYTYSIEIVPYCPIYFIISIGLLPVIYSIGFIYSIELLREMVLCINAFISFENFSKCKLINNLIQYPIKNLS